MGSSLGFGSTPYNFIRPVRTRFRYGFASFGLTLLHSSNSLTHYAKGTRSPAYGAPTACRHAISGTISLPYQGCFSPFPYGTCSLSVICVYLALGDGPPGFQQGFTCPIVLRCQFKFLGIFGYGAITLCGWFSNPIFLILTILVCHCNNTTTGPATLYMQRVQAYTYRV